ncbi:MAG: type II CAAX endopeptidase family protein [bacterium]
MNTSSLEAGLAGNAKAIILFYAIVAVLGLAVDGAFLAIMSRRGLRWRERLSRFYWRPWGDGEAIALFATLVALFALAGHCRSFLVDFIEDLGMSIDSGLILLQSVIFHWTGLVLVTAWLLWKRIPWSSAFGISFGRLPRSVVQGVVFLLGTMPVLFFYTLIYHVGLSLFGREPTLQDVAFAISEETTSAMRSYFFVLAVFIAPCFEEILFRGIAMTVLAKRIGAGAAVTITSAIFALMHGHVPSLVPLFILSISLSLAYIYSESLLVPMVMHSLFNFVSVTFLFTAQ